MDNNIDLDLDLIDNDEDLIKDIDDLSPPVQDIQLPESSVEGIDDDDFDAEKYVKHQFESVIPEDTTLQKVERRVDIRNDLIRKAKYVNENRGRGEKYSYRGNTSAELGKFIESNDLLNLSHDEVNELQYAVDGIYSQAVKDRWFGKVFWDAINRSGMKSGHMAMQSLYAIKKADEEDVENLKAMSQAYQEMELYDRPKYIQQVWDIRGAKDAFMWALEATGDNSVHMTATMGAFMIPVVGAYAGIATSMVLNTGEAIGDQIEEDRLHRGYALLQGAGYTAVELATGSEVRAARALTGGGFRRVAWQATKEIRKEAAQKAAKEAFSTTWKEFFKFLVKQGIGEGLEEVIQNNITRTVRAFQTGDYLGPDEHSAWDAAVNDAEEFLSAFVSTIGHSSFSHGYKTRQNVREVRSADEFLSRLGIERARDAAKALNKYTSAVADITENIKGNADFYTLSPYDRAVLANTLISNAKRSSYASLFGDGPMPEDRSRRISKQLEYIDNIREAALQTMSEDAVELLKTYEEAFSVHGFEILRPQDEGTKPGIITIPAKNKSDFNVHALHESKRQEVNADGTPTGNTIYRDPDSGIAIIESKEGDYTVYNDQGYQMPSERNEFLASEGDALRKALKFAKQLSMFNNKMLEINGQKMQLVEAIANRAYPGINVAGFEGPVSLPDGVRERFIKQSKGKAMYGFFDDETNTVYVDVRNIRSPIDAATTLFHESLHEGFRNWWSTLNQKEKENYTDGMTDEQFKAFEESLVSMHEASMIMPGSFEDALGATVRKFARKVLGANWSLSQGEVNLLINRILPHRTTSGEGSFEEHRIVRGEDDSVNWRNVEKKADVDEKADTDEAPTPDADVDTDEAPAPKTEPAAEPEADVDTDEAPAPKTEPAAEPEADVDTDEAPTPEVDAPETRVELPAGEDGDAASTTEADESPAPAAETDAKPVKPGEKSKSPAQEEKKDVTLEDALLVRSSPGDKHYDTINSAEGRPEGSSETFTVITPDGAMEVSGQFDVVDADDFLTGKDAGYYGPFQGRERNSVESQKQVLSIANDPRAIQLDGSPISDSGSPIVLFKNGSDHVVSGNGRATGLRLAYQVGNAEKYRTHVEQRAKAMGFDTSGMKAPILVRRANDMSLRDGEIFAEKSNADQKLAFTAAELAVRDAKVLEDNPQAIRMYNPSDSGNMYAASNHEFLVNFVDKTGDTSLRHQSGKFTDAIEKRVWHALIFRMLGKNTPENRAIITRLAEEASEYGVVRQVAGLGMAAQTLLDIANNHPDYDLTPALSRALEKLLDYRGDLKSGRIKPGTSFAEFSRQLFFDGFDNVSHMEKTATVLAEMLAEVKSVKQIKEFFDNYERIVSALIERGGGLFEELEVSDTDQAAADALQRARERINGTEEQDIFSFSDGDTAKGQKPSNPSTDKSNDSDRQSKQQKPEDTKPRQETKPVEKPKEKPAEKKAEQPVDKDAERKKPPTQAVLNKYAEGISDGITLRVDSSNVVAEGETFPNKERLRDRGFTWNPGKKWWQKSVFSFNLDLDVEDLGRFDTKTEAQAAFDANPMSQTPLAAIREVWGSNEVEIEEAGGEIRISGKDAKAIKEQLKNSLGMKYNNRGKYWFVKTKDARAKIRDGALERYKDTRTSLQKASTDVAPTETSVDEATALLMEAAGLDVGDAAKAATEQAEQSTEASVEAETVMEEVPAKETPVEQPTEDAADTEQAKQIDDFGEKLEGARKDMPKVLTDDISDSDIASQPFSKTWPNDAHEKIEDDLAAALAFVARENVPAKPRTPYKIKRWVKTVNSMLEIVRDPALALRVVESLESEEISYATKSLLAKAKLLSQLPRNTWKRIGEVRESPNAMTIRSDEELESAGFHKNERGYWLYTTPDGTEASLIAGIDPNSDLYDKVYKPDPNVRVTIDGKTEVFEGVGKIGVEQVEAIQKLLGEKVAPTKGALTTESFEIWGYKNRSDTWYISKKGDPERRVLKEFKGETAVRDARAFLNSNLSEVVSEWEAVKARDNVSEEEARRNANRERKGVERRGGKDVTEQMFTESFGFRGVQFGNWVSQGKNAKERQGMLNQAFDALHDLADVLGIPSQAVSLNGSLGLAFGARGTGKASAHFEPDTLVINLTKTRGAGSLAHEWFHAMDNYFSRMRGERRGYITYAPSTTARLTSSRNFVLPKSGMDSGVRAEIESAFTTLVGALNDSPMTARAKTIDKSQNGYWSRTIERAARSFENYIISKMNERGWSNDYLANIRNFEEWREIGKNAERYPYLLAEEEAPIVAAYDALFNTIETKQDSETGGTIMFRMEQSQIDNIMRAGMVLANNFFAKGGRSFGDFRKSIQEKFGNKFDAYIPTWYEEAASLQQAEKRIKKDEVTNTAEIRSGIDTGVGEEESGASARERTDERGRVLPDAGRSRPADIRGVDQDGRSKRPPLRVAQAQLIPDAPQVVRSDTYSKANGIVLGDDQVLAVNLAIDAFERDRPAFLLADGAGVGKTMVMLATADQFRKRSKTEASPRILIIGQNKQSIQTRFAEDAKALGVSTSGFRFETYSGLATMVKNGAINWDLVIFDEAHNLKNADSQRSMAAAGLRSPHKLFATATPIDKPTGAAYFMAELTGKTEQEVALALGYRIEEQRDEKTGAIVSRPVLLENVSWHKVWANIKILRNAAIADGTMVRREFPFYGKADLSEKSTLTKAQRSTDNLIDMYFENLIKEAGGSPTARRNYSGQRTLTWGRANEYRKVPQAVELAEKALSEGKQVIIVAETDKMQSFPVQVEDFTDTKEFSSKDGKQSWLRWYRPGAISQAEALLAGRGITDISHIHDTKNNVVADEMRKFQSGENRVVLMTPQSGGTSIDLDDKAGGKPRMMIVLSKNFAGDQFEQVLYRVSRRNTASPAEVVFLENDGTSDSIRNDTLSKKLGTLRAIQGDTDIDDAVGLNTGDAEVGTIRFRTADQVAQEFTETEQRIGGRPAYDAAKQAGKTALNYRQWVQVRTPAFKEWFGDWEGDPENASKVVHPETGEPLVVYHGTKHDFTEFQLSVADRRDAGWFGDGFYLTASRELASSYAMRERDYSLTERPANVMPVYVRMSNPYRINLAELSYDEGSNFTKKHGGNKGFQGWLVDNGYDGVIGYRDPEIAGQGAEFWEIVAFSPSQIKSATANDGSFSAQTGDIRFRAVTPEQDAEYMRAVESGDMETARHMVDEAALVAGAMLDVYDEYDEFGPLKVYHGSPNVGFTAFDPAKRGSSTHSSDTFMGDFFTKSSEVAKEFFAGNKGEVRAFYIMGDKVLDTTNISMEDFESMLFGSPEEQAEAGYDYRDYKDSDRAKEKFDEFLKEVVKDDPIIRVDDPQFAPQNPEFKTGFFIVRDSSRIKSADPVTYDDAGNVIPLSDRFNEASNDIRFRATGDIRFRRRTDADPSKTVKAYKLFRVKDGKLFPLFVEANDPVPIGVWLDAEEGEMDTAGKVKSKLGPLAYRPGWHAGDLPIATHIGEKKDKADAKPSYRPDNQVWAEVEMAADVDWQAEANKRGENSKGVVIAKNAAITDQIPVNGFYRYKTNPNMTGNWLIGGSMMVVRILSDEEVSAVNDRAGVKDLPRKTPFDAKAHGFGDDIRFRRSGVTPEQDAAYMDAVKRGDMETARHMVDEAARAAGYSVQVYHGSDNAGFWVFRTAESDGVFATDSQDVARGYSTARDAELADWGGSYMSPVRSHPKHFKRGARQGTYSLMAKLGKSLRVDADGASWSNLPASNGLTRRSIYSYELTKDNANGFMPLLRIKEVYNNKQAAPTIIEEYARTMDSPISLEEEAGKSSGDAMWQLSATPLGDWDAAYSNDNDSFIISASIPFSTIDEYNNFARQHISPYAVLLGRDLVKYEGKRYSPEDIKRARENRIFVKPHEWRNFTPSIKLLNNINTRKVADFARNNGYDSAVIENVIDNGPNMHDGGSLVPHTVYWFRDSSSLKMANLATYDDAGNVIPLSDRFNEASNDIRFRAVGQADFGPDFRPGRRHFSTKAHIADLLVKFGLEPYTVKDRITNQSTLDEALAIVKERPDEASVIMLNLRNSKRPATPVERTILLLEVPGITEGLEQASAAMNEAAVGTREHDSATARFEAYSNKAAELSEVMGMAGTAAGQALQAIKIGVFDDFSLAGMMAAASKANNYQPLTPDQLDFVKQFYDEYSKDKAEFERRIGKEKKVGQTLQDLKKEARKRKLSPDNYMDRARTLLERKLNAQGGDITKGDLSSVLQMIARAIVTEDPSIQTDPFNVELHKRFFDLVGTIFPDLTQAETEGLFSGYGQIQYPSSEEVDVRLRQLRELDRLRSQLRDVEEGDAPLRTGKQRDDSTHEARELQKKINALMKEMGIVSDDPKRQIKTPLDALKQRIRNRIEDLEHAIRNPYLGGLVDNSIPMELDDEAKSLKDRRDFLQKIYNDIFNEPDDDAKRLRTALKIAQRNLEHAKQRLERAKVGDFSREAKRESVTSAELESLRQQRDSINALIEQLQEEMAPEINAEKRLQRWRKSVHQRVAMYDERIENEDFAKKPVNVHTLSEEDYKLHRKLENKKREFTRKMEAWREKNQPLPSKIVSRVRKTSELVKAIRASYDWSALGRQGLWSSLAHPVLAAKAMNQMARATFSQINADRYFDEMQLDPDFQRAEQASLALVDPSADAAFMEKEERFAGRIQRFGGKAGNAFFAGIDASDRAYSTFLNFMRFEMFKSILRQHPTGNPTLQELKVIGHFVNAATGRGDITSNPQFAKGLSAILWAPRLQMSRIQMMLGEPIARAALHKESWATKAISKEYGRMMLGTGIIGLIAWLFASLFNDDDDPRPDIGLDSRSTQFGKVRYGDQFLDLTSGAGQMVVLGTKIITGERKTKYGQVVDLRGPNKGYKESTWSEITSALRGKLLPIIGLSFDLVEGESMVGRPTRTLPYVARSLLVPLGIDQMIETAVEDGWAPGMLVGAAELLGFSASNYQTEIFRFVERDYMSASKAWRDAKTQQERDAILLRAPFLKNKGQLDAIRSRINKIKRTMKRYEDADMDTTPLENQLAQAQAQFHQIMVEANK